MNASFSRQTISILPAIWVKGSKSSVCRKPLTETRSECEAECEKGVYVRGLNEPRAAPVVMLVIMPIEANTKDIESRDDFDKSPGICNTSTSDINMSAQLEVEDVTGASETILSMTFAQLAPF